MKVLGWLLDRLGDLAALVIPEDPGDATVARHPAVPRHVRILQEGDA